MNRNAGFQPAHPPPSTHPLLIDPAAPRWRASLSPRPLPHRARRFREQLGLPTAGPLIMTGHQAEFWHPGILSKYLAADAAARAWGAQTAWIVVDQDANDFASVRYPVRTPEGRLVTRTWQITRASLTAADGHPLPTGSIPPFTPEPLPALPRGDRFAADSVEPGLRAIREALLRHVGAARATDLPRPCSSDRQQPPAAGQCRTSERSTTPRSAADQIRRALDDLLLPFVSRAPSVFATNFARTDLFREVVDRMRDDPAPCVRAYNAAVAAHPHARMAPLALNDTQYIYELPLWRIDPAARGQRRRVYAEDLDNISIEQLAPRAALMTGLLRLADAGGCELFIAGTGGGGDRGYERVAEQWLQAWLGEPLTPEAVVTATLHLDMGAAPVSEADVTRALWRAHHARHDPAMLGDEHAAREKMQLVHQIETRRAEGGDPHPDYRRMHQLLQRTRDDRRAELAAIEADSARMLARRQETDILTTRTWPFPLHDPATLAALKQRINKAFE